MNHQEVIRELQAQQSFFATMTIVLLFVAVILTIWFISSIVRIKRDLYNTYDQVYDLRECAERIESVIGDKHDFKTKRPKV